MVWALLAVVLVVITPVALVFISDIKNGVFERHPKVRKERGRKSITYTSQALHSEDPPFYRYYIEQYVATGNEDDLENALKSMEPIENETVSF